MRRGTSFGSVADAYERARPEYPEQAIRWLTGEPPRDVVDLGAGTGKLTRGIAALGHRVTAVEPLVEMRAQLLEAVPAVTVIEGTAEEIPLPDASADVVTVAQAFHWFDHATSLREIARVLRPGGRVALIWNMRDESVPWVSGLSELVGRESVDDEDAAEPVRASGAFGPVEQATFAHDQTVDRQLLLDLVRSRSRAAVMPDNERDRLLAAVGALYDEVAGGAPSLVLPYVTECFRAERL